MSKTIGLMLAVTVLLVAGTGAVAAKGALRKPFGVIMVVLGVYFFIRELLAA
jgi:hypothetical protein